MYYPLISSMSKVLPTNALWNNLLAYYTADNTPNDALGVNNGTLINGATYATGKINNGFSLDGVNDYVDLNTTNLKFTSSFSVSFFMKHTSNTGNFGLISTTGGAYNGWAIGMYSGHLEFWFDDRPIQAYVDCVSSTILTINTWNHIVFTFELGVGFKLYINGTLNKSSSKPLFVPSYTQAPIYYPNVGAFSTLSGTRSLFYNGLIDELGIWNRLLTTLEVTELYNSGSGKQYPL